MSIVCVQHCDTAAMLNTPPSLRAWVLTSPEVLQVDRLCRSIAQAVNAKLSAFIIIAFIRSYLR